MPRNDIRFGTDGWRGTIAEDYTFANVRRAAQGFARYLLDQGHRGAWVVVGYDKRFHSENFAAAAAEVLAAHDLRVYLTQEATPTPVISYAVVDKGAVAAINITASHNPPGDNGFKVRDRHGGALPPAALRAVEARIPATEDAVVRVPLAEAQAQGRVVVFDPKPAYIAHLRELVDLERIRDAGLKVLVDPMWGNGAGWFPRLIGGGRTVVEEIHNVRNPIFPEMKRPEPIPPNVDVGLAETVRRGADVLIINDGDADRLGLGDEHGRFVDQLKVYGLLAYYFLEVRGERGPIVKTISTTALLNKMGRQYGVPVYETGVGFKYVAPKMLEVNALIGGEESGGYAFRNHVPERDGILAGLYVLDMMVRLNKKPSELVDLLFRAVGPTHYKRIDVPFQGDRGPIEARVRAARPATIGGLKVVGFRDLDGYQFLLEDGGWLLIRFSGTEPLLRVYCETTDPARLDAILHDGLRIAGVTPPAEA